MRISALAAVAVVALAVGGLAPATAAEAATSSVSGVVTYKGEPVGNMIVGWVEPSTGVSAHVRSSSDGSYSLAAPTTGHKYVVYANLGMTNFSQTRQTRQYAGTFYGAGNERSFAYQTLTPYVSGTNQSVAVSLGRTGRLSGADPDLAHEYIYLTTTGGQQVRGVDGESRVRATSTGAFSFAGLVPGSYSVTVDPYSEKVFTISSPPVTVVEEETVIAPLEVNYGAIITGRVKDASGKALSKVRVEVTASGNSRDILTDSSGRYTLAAIPGSKNRVIIGGVATSNTKLAVAKTTLVTGLTNGETRTVNFTATIGAKIEGKLSAATAKSRTFLYIQDSRKTLIYSDYASEKYSVSGLGSGTYYVTVIDYGTNRYFTRKVTAKVGVTSSLGLQSPSEKTVTVSGTISGKSTFGSGNDFVVAENAAGFSAGSELSSTGKYSISGLIPGSYRLTVHLLNRDPRLYTGVSLRSSQTKNLTAGVLQGAARGVIAVNGVRVKDGYVSAGEYSSTVSNGSFSSRTEAGEYTFDTVLVSDLYVQGQPGNGFQEGSSFWVSFPETKSTFTVQTGQTTNLGTVELVVHQ